MRHEEKKQKQGMWHQEQEKVRNKSPGTEKHKHGMMCQEDRQINQEYGTMKGRTEDLLNMENFYGGRELSTI